MTEARVDQMNALGDLSFRLQSVIVVDQPAVALIPSWVSPDLPRYRRPRAGWATEDGVEEEHVRPVHEGAVV